MVSWPSLPSGGHNHHDLHADERDAIDAEFVGVGAGTSDIGGVRLESFAGSTDDEKLGNAMSFVASQTYKPPILLLENREYGTFTTPRDIFSGFKLLGGPAFSNQYRAALSIPQRVNVNISGGGAWLRLGGGSTFDVQIARLSFYSQSSTTDFLGGHSTGVLWTSVIRDVGFSLFRHTIGSPGTKLLITAVQFDGWWNINNSRGTAVTIGGADSALWTSGVCLIDSAPNIAQGNVPWHIDFNHMSKCVVGAMFITAEEVPAAIRVTGSLNAPALIFQGTRMEGRNTNQSSYGAVVRVEGGMVNFRDCWIAYGMSNSGATGRSGENGIVNVAGNSRVLLDGCHYSRAGGDGVAETVPFVYATGSNARVRVSNAWASTLGGSFTGLPRVQAADGAALNTDNSVTEI